MALRKKFKSSIFAKMESGIDDKGQMLSAISAIYGEGLNDKLPLVLFYDKEGNVYLFSSGYKIGMGEQLLKIISALEAHQKGNGKKV